MDADYPYEVVVAESGDCKCGADSHEKGYVLWGSEVPPTKMDGHDPIETVSKYHSVEVEYRKR